MGASKEPAFIESPLAEPAEPDFQARAQELRIAHKARRTPHYRSILMHWLRRSLQRPRRAAAEPLPTVSAGQVGITYAGHATVLIRYAGRNIVCDPVLGEWVRGVKRAVTPGLSPADLHDVNVILITHAHPDHLDRTTLAMLPRSATIVVPPRSAHRVSDLGFARVVELSAGQPINDHGVDIQTAPAKHGDNLDYQALSYVIRGDGPSIFFCGDSGYFPGFRAVGKQFQPDIAILPIGGYLPLSFRERHMSPLDALYALEDLGARIMIPIHHGTFVLSYEQLDEPSRWLAELVHERGLKQFVVELEAGQSRIFVPPRTQRAQTPVAGDASIEGPLRPLRIDASEHMPPLVGPEALPEVPAYVRMRLWPQPWQPAAAEPEVFVEPVPALTW